MLLPWDYEREAPHTWYDIRLPWNRVLEPAQRALSAGLGNNGIGWCYLPSAMASLPAEPVSAEMQLEDVPAIGLKLARHVVTGYTFLDKRSQDRYLLWFYNIDPKDYV